MLPALLATHLRKGHYRTAVLRLQDVLGKREQLLPEPVHTFSPGYYTRTVTMPADMVGIGKVHKKHHTLTVVSGTLTVAWEGGVTTLTGPVSVACPPNTKRTLYAHTEVTLRTEHVVSAQTFDLAAIEAELVADSYEDSMKE